MKFKGKNYLMGGFNSLHEKFGLFQRVFFFEDKIIGLVFQKEVPAFQGVEYNPENIFRDSSAFKKEQVLKWVPKVKPFQHFFYASDLPIEYSNCILEATTIEAPDVKDMYRLLAAYVLDFAVLNDSPNNIFGKGVSNLTIGFNMHTKHLVGPMNAKNETSINKMQPYHFFSSQTILPLIVSTTPYEGASYSEHVNVCLGPTVSDVDLVPIQIQDLKQDMVYAKLSVKGLTSLNSLIKAGEPLKYTIALQDCSDETPVELNANGAEIYLESTAGYLNKTRYILGSDNSFSIRAQDLYAGDKIKIKAGWYNFSGLAEVILTVV